MKTGCPLFYWQKNQRLSRNFWGPFRSQQNLPSPPDPYLSSPPSLPLKVGPFNPARGSGERCELPSVGSRVEPQLKSNLVHFSLKWHLVATILTTVLRINWPNLVLEMWEISVMCNFQGHFSRTFQDQSDFPGLSRSWNFKEKKIQEFPGHSRGVETLWKSLSPKKQLPTRYN